MTADLPTESPRAPQGWRQAARWQSQKCETCSSPPAYAVVSYRGRVAVYNATSLACRLHVGPIAAGKADIWSAAKVHAL